MGSNSRALLISLNLQYVKVFSLSSDFIFQDFKIKIKSIPHHHHQSKDQRTFRNQSQLQYHLHLHPLTYRSSNSKTTLAIRSSEIWNWSDWSMYIYLDHPSKEPQLKPVIFRNRFFKSSLISKFSKTLWSQLFHLSWTMLKPLGTVVLNGPTAFHSQPNTPSTVSLTHLLYSS